MLVEMLEEKKKLVKMLLLWEEVKKQGINPDDVVSFGFDPALMSSEEHSQARKASPLKYTYNNPYAWPIVRREGKLVIVGVKHNYVKLITGEKRKLSPMIDNPN